MRRRSARYAAVLGLTLLASCAGRAPAPATPASAQATAKGDASAAFLGHWAWNAQVGGDSYAGTLELSRAPDGTLRAKIVEDAMGELPVTGVRVDGTTMTLNVDADGNPASVVATLQADGTIAGRVLVAGGEGTFQARKG